MIRRLTQFHEREKLITAAQTAAGQFAIWVIGIALLFWHDRTMLMLASFTLVLLFPGRRRLLLAIAAIGVVFEVVLGSRGLELGTASLSLNAVNSWPWLRFSIQVAVAIVGIYLVSVSARRFDRFAGIIKRFPLVTLHILIWLALILSSLPALGGLGFVSYIACRLS